MTTNPKDFLLNTDYELDKISSNSESDIDKYIQKVNDLYESGCNKYNQITNDYVIPEVGQQIKGVIRSDKKSYYNVGNLSSNYRNTNKI